MVYDLFVFDTADTIAAVSSPPGPAPRGIVRLSGPRALPLGAHLFHPDGATSLTAAASSTCLSGRVRIPDGEMPASAFVFRRPRSYTRDDLVEIHLLGSPGLLALLLDEAVRYGARPAGPGEFTARAFLAGAMDLAEAQGVAAMVRAGSDDELRAARGLLDGRLSDVARAAREELADLLSLVEGALDFADEPIEFIAPAELRRRLGELEARLSETLRAAAAAERFGEWPRVLLAGPANAGKSSLFNRLCGSDRAICSPAPGTTRDVLTAPIRLACGGALLIDVAGEHPAADDVSRRARAAAEAERARADLLLHVADATADSTPPRAAEVPTIRVLNKVDLLDDPAALRAREIEGRPEGEESPPFVAVSARTGAGCDRLIRRIESLLSARGRDRRECDLALYAEHRDGLAAAIEAVRRARSLVGDSTTRADAADLVALELHEAADRLAALTGELAADELLGRIFSRFCIGK